MTKAEFFQKRAVADFEKRVGVTVCAPATASAPSVAWEEGRQRGADAERMVAHIGGLLASRQYDWARRTLVGIRATVYRTKRVTLRQREAVAHIVAGGVKHAFASRAAMGKHHDKA